MTEHIRMRAFEAAMGMQMMISAEGKTPLQRILGEAREIEAYLIGEKPTAVEMPALEGASTAVEHIEAPTNVVHMITDEPDPKPARKPRGPNKKTAKAKPGRKPRAEATVSEAASVSALTNGSGEHAPSDQGAGEPQMAA